MDFCLAAEKICWVIFSFSFFGSGTMERIFGYENGIVMTRDPKPRLRWTADLHDRFVDAVTKLGGPDSMSNSPLLFSIFF